MTLLIIFVGIIAFGNLVLLLGLALLAIAIKRLIDTGVKPVMADIRSTVGRVNAVVDRLEDRTEQIMNIGEKTVKQVSGKVVATTDMMQESITSPLIRVSSLLAGLSKALETWRCPSVRS